MAVAALTPVEDYLRTSYQPDCDYVDGEVIERNLGERERSTAQRNLIVFITINYPSLIKRVYPEHRVQVAVSRFRVPDLCISSVNAPPYEKIIQVPPALCIEILSPEDTMSRTLEKVKDYLAMGVPICWIIDPVKGAGWVATPGRLDDVTDGVLRADSLKVPLAEILETT